MAEETKTKEDCIFCKIVRGEVPCYKVYEDKDCLVFLDAFPSMKGQTLVIPKKHLEPFLFKVANEDYIGLMNVAKKIALAMQKSLKPVKTGLLVEGLELDHVHIKLFPLSSEGFRNVSRLIEPRPSEIEMKELADKIKRAL